MIFIYERAAKVPSSHLKALREAGVVPVQVESLDKAKVLSPELSELPMNGLLLDMLKTIADAGAPYTTRFTRSFYATLQAHFDDKDSA